MKLLSSFKKEFILATRSFYFYVEFGFALVILAVLLFAIPENLSPVEAEYIYPDLPDAARQYFIDDLMTDDLDGKIESVALEAGGETFDAQLIATNEKECYILSSEQAVRTMSEKERNIGAVLSLDSNNEMHYTYYLQGYESERLRNLLLIIHNEDMTTMEARYNAQEVRYLTSDFEPLNDRENAIPPMLAFNSALMGMFIMASYVFLDKKEGVIKAYAVTASSVSRYLLSKMFVVMLTAIISTLIIVIPVMGSQPNYALMLLFLLTSGFFASVFGLLIASLFDDIEKAFGLIFFLLILMMLPGIAYFIPSWDPLWIKFLPSYPIIEAFKECILDGGDAVYVLIASAGFLAAGGLLFGLTNRRFKRTLSV